MKMIKHTSLPTSVYSGVLNYRVCLVGWLILFAVAPSLKQLDYEVDIPQGRCQILDFFNFKSQDPDLR